MRLVGATMLSLLLAGCATNSTPTIVTPDLICVGTEECKRYWERAQIWVVRASTTKIQTATDVVIETYDPEAIGGNSMNNWFRITREPLGSDRELLALETGCGNFIWGCTVRPDVARREFYEYVTASIVEE